MNTVKTDFSCDYSIGAAKEVLDALCQTNDLQTDCYGNDVYSNAAKEKIKEAIGNKDADIWFLVGGTQTNATVLDALLKKYEGVISATSGHIAVHEAGAIEFTGHKVIEVESDNTGKIVIDSLIKYLKTFYADPTYSHMVIPGAVYISHPTEFGGLYSKAELNSLREVCDEYGMKLYLDGARLAYALAGQNDVTIKDISALCDAFYIGGTKCGTLFGEAVVLKNKTLAPHFLTHIKQHGALLAKGRILGVQFDRLFTDNLYFELGKKAINAAEYMCQKLKEKNVRFLTDSPTNQQFIIVDDKKLKELDGNIKYSFWSKYDDSSTVIRLCTSFATEKQDIDNLITFF